MCNKWVGCGREVQGVSIQHKGGKAGASNKGNPTGQRGKGGRKHQGVDILGEGKGTWQEVATRSRQRGVAGKCKIISQALQCKHSIGGRRIHKNS